MAQIHRFHNKVAVYVDGSTKYLTAKEAIRYGNELVKYGRDVKRSTFLDSNIGTFNMELSDPNHDKRD